MKTHRIELQRLKAASNSSQSGTVSFHMDCLINPLRLLEDAEPSSELVMSEANARVLMALLKKQLAAFDARKARSQR